MILKAIEKACMKCERRKTNFLKQSIGQLHHSVFQDSVRPVRYVQKDFTGKHSEADGKSVYGLVCICMQTYNVRIYTVNDRALKSVYMWLTTLVAEFGSPELLCCDREAAFVKLDKFEKNSHWIIFRFVVPNGHFITG